MIRVLIVDDQKLILEGLSMILGFSNNIKVVGTASNGRDAIDFIKKEAVDLILMDIRMPIMDGVEAIKIIKEKYPDIKVFILTTFNEDEYIFEALKNGASGYFLKDTTSDELIKAIEAAYNGNVLLQHEIASRIVNTMEKQGKDNKLLKELTNREKEIALLVGQGKTNKEIADILFITEGTVKNHITRILDKLQFRDRTMLAVNLNCDLGHGKS